MENYEKVHAALAERLGYSELYMRLHNLRSGPWGSLTSRVIIDNAERHADEVVKLLIDYLDCMMEQIRREEPDTTTNYFTVTADGERMQFYAEELILDSDEPEWQRWLALRQRFLTGNQLEFESQYISGPGEEVYLGGDVPKLLKEPLKDGRLAEWVTLTVILDNEDYRDWREYSRPYHQDIWKRYYYEKAYEERGYYDFLGQRFWMNGLYNGEYRLSFEACAAQADPCWQRRSGSWYAAAGGRAFQRTCALYHRKRQCNGFYGSLWTDGGPTSGAA